MARGTETKLDINVLGSKIGASEPTTFHFEIGSSRLENGSRNRRQKSGMYTPSVAY